MLNFDSKNNQLIAIKGTEYAVVSHTIAPEVRELPFERLAVSRRILATIDVLFHPRANFFAHLSIELLELFDGALGVLKALAHQANISSTSAAL